MYELAADVILPSITEASPAGEQGTQPGPEALGWLGLPNPGQVAPPAWAALGLPEPPPEVHIRWYMSKHGVRDLLRFMTGGKA